MLKGTSFLIQSLVAGYLLLMARDFYLEAKKNGMLMWRFTYLFGALAFTFLWIWIGYFEDMTDFLPGLELRRITIRYRLIPYMGLLASLVAVRRGLRKGRR